MSVASEGWTELLLSVPSPFWRAILKEQFSKTEYGGYSTVG